MTESVTIYGKDNCPHTQAALKTCREHGQKITYIDVLESSEKMEAMLQVSGGQRRVPVLVQGDTVTIGWQGQS